VAALSTVQKSSAFAGLLEGGAYGIRISLQIGAFFWPVYAPVYAVSGSSWHGRGIPAYPSFLFTGAFTSWMNQLS
jgi:hypothetical protein